MLFEKPIRPIVCDDDSLVRYYLTMLRNRLMPDGASNQEFAETGSLLSLLLLARVLRHLDIYRDVIVTTPLNVPTTGCVLDVSRLYCIAVLRAGRSFFSALDLLHLPIQRGTISLHRDEATFVAVDEGGHELPECFPDDVLIMLVDPMLARAGTAVKAVSFLKKLGAKKIVFVGWLAAKKAVRMLQKAHPDIPIVVGAVDKKLDDKAYIVPGLGNAGDRMFGKKDPVTSVKSPEDEETRVCRGKSVAGPYSGTSLKTDPMV